MNANYFFRKEEIYARLLGEDKYIIALTYPHWTASWSGSETLCKQET